MQSKSYMMSHGRGVKASRLLFENIIDIDRRTGILTLDSKRMLLISAEAMGILRRDLVSTLGMERAKGFLMRYGWAYGYNDGDAVGKMFRWDSLKEYILSGPVLATMEGIVTVEIEALDIIEGEFYSHGYWKHSYEAEEHIRHFGRSDEAVCYSIVGYASGFLTKVLGKSVLVKESRCKAKGDDCCYFIAKTVDETDPDYQEDLRYYQAESLASELDAYNKEIQELNRIMVHSEEISNKLTDFMLEGKNLYHLIDFLSKAINRSIVIEKVKRNGINEAVWKAETDLQLYERWKEAGSSTGQFTESFTCDSFDLQANHSLLGTMVVVGANELTKQERMIIRRVVSVITTHLYHQRSINKWNWKMKADLFEEILRGNYDEQELRRRISDSGIDFSSAVKVVCIKLKSADELEHVMSYINLKFPLLEAFISKDRIVLIVSREWENSVRRSENPEMEEHNFETRLKNMLQRKFSQTNIYVGSGRVANSIVSLGKSYQDAYLITDFVQVSFLQENAVASFEQLEHIMLFIKSLDHDEFISFCHNVLGKLIDNDLVYQSDLLLSLKAYLDNSGNLANTSRELHLSITGLRYRIRRIEELCGINLNDGMSRLKYHLAVQIYFTLRLINKNPFTKS
ncbi:XylR N-terminal domain-containing protein [Paenibacillus validus]|nr:XylR N-terminal domain-containing protein [Paenibacillus validus]